MIIREQENKIIYSDGEETEQKMLQIARSYPEDKAEDFIASDSSYTVNNTFSAVRRNILNWYSFKEHCDILEVGAGMGAVTGLLCDVADSVVAIEMSRARAEVIRARYPDRDNLTVLSENINSWDTEKRFDYAVFIGVLEYAAVFSDASCPYEEFLNNVKKFLKPEGIILFAIENRFGLKYWLGGSEDHLQEPFAGIRGYEKEKSPRTFSRRELEEILLSAGLSHFRFYSVLPDYKFPELIFSDEYKPNSMNLKKVSFTYSKNSTLLADEKTLYKDIVENKVFPFFANSFLVEASAQELENRHAVMVSSKGEAHKQYRVSTVMDSCGRVYKIPMHREAAVHIQNIIRNTEELSEKGVRILPVRYEDGLLVSDYFDAPSAQDIFSEALKENDRKTVKLLLDRLSESLKKSSGQTGDNVDNILVQQDMAEPGADYGPILQKAFIDMTFYNAFWVDEELVFYDQEWCLERVPLKFCLYYSLKSAYGRADVRTGISFGELMEYLEIAPAETSAYEKLEEFIWSKVLYRQTDFYGADGYCNRYCEEMTLRAGMQRLENTVNSLNESTAKQLEENGNLVKENNALKEINVLELKENARLKSELEELEEETIRLRDLEKQHQMVVGEMEALRQERADLQQTIRNKEGHIELLLETEREYEREKRSRTYRMARVFRRISTFFLPADSRRRFFAKLLAKGLRHPIRMVRMINPRRIKNCFTILRTEGTGSASSHLRLVEEFERSGSVDGALEKLDIEKVAENPENPHTLEDYAPLLFALPEEPLVSIIIPAYNQFDYTYHCLESIHKHSGAVPYEILLADDGSTDLTRDIETRITGIRVIRNEENLRFLKNCNHAAEQAKGKYLLFLNNDTQVQADWLRPLVDRLESDASVGMTGSRLVYPDGHLQEAGGIFWKDASAWNYGHMQNPEDPEYNYVKDADYISGASILIRRSLWEEIGGFDERFAPAYYEDADLAFEVRKHGYRVVYQPKSVVVHFEGISNGTDVTSGQKKYQAENQKKFYDKWKEVLEAEHFPNGENVFLARDKSRDKKCILVIDHYVPMFDKDAGSRTIWQYINLFVDKGYNVKFLGDNFYPHEPYTTALQQAGVEVLYGPWYANNYKQWILDNKDNIGFAFLNRPHITEKYIDFLKKETAIKCIYYGCDLHCMRIRREYELLHSKKLLMEAEDWEKREFAIMRKTDMNYYPSSVEIDQIHSVDATIPAKRFDIYVYEKFRENIPLDFGRREGLLFVGGFGHPPNEDAVQWFAGEIYPLIQRQGDMPFYIVGANPTEKVKKLEGNGVVIKGFVTDEELQCLYDTCRMAVVPLRYGAGVKGKVIEALYNGIPMVTTSIGIEGITGAEQFVEIADNAEAFANKVIDLYNNTHKLADTVQVYQDYVKKHCSVEAVWNHIKDDFTR